MAAWSPSDDGRVRQEWSVMEAVNLVGLVLGFGLAIWAAWASWYAMVVTRRIKAVEEAQRDADARPLPDTGPDLNTRIIERLLDAAIPVAEVARVDNEPAPVTPGEYEPPWEPARDWTDPFFGIERPTSMGLSPGAPIPGIGPVDGEPSSEDEWHRIYDDAPETRGFEVMDEYLADNSPADATTWNHRALGAQAFEDWEAARGQ